MSGIGHGTGKQSEVKFRKGSCIVCGHGNDTGVAVRGEAEWAHAALRTLGIPDWQCVNIISNGTGCDPGKVPVGVFTLIVNVCQACADASPLAARGLTPALMVDGAGLPLIDQPEHLRGLD